jgi:hypothetical protein
VPSVVEVPIVESLADCIEIGAEGVNEDDLAMIIRFNECTEWSCPWVPLMITVRINFQGIIMTWFVFSQDFEIA